MTNQASEELLPDTVQLVIAWLGALLVGALYIVLPERLILGPSWLLLVLDAALLALPIIAAVFLRRALPYRVARGLAVALLLVLTAALIGSVILLINTLGEFHSGTELLRGAGLLWVINVLVFGVWDWEIDGNGPLSRLKSGHQAADFQFPQQVGGNQTGWAPGFVDYLFLAFCSATALSPADTMPLTHRAKLLMMSESTISLLIIVLLVARAVNIGIG